MRCQWCGEVFSGRYYQVNGSGTFCSEKCANEWQWESGGGKEKQREYEEFRQRQEKDAQNGAERNRQYLANQKAEKEHFRPFIEQRVGHLLNLDDVWFNHRLNTWVAKEELFAEAGAAMKVLEKETGVPVSAIIPLEISPYNINQCYWGGNTWVFSLPDDKAMSCFYSTPVRGNDGEVLITTSRMCRPYKWWFNAESVSPYMALAEYEGKKVQNVTDFPQYALVEKFSCLVSLTELEQKLGYDRAAADVSFSPMFEPTQNIFYVDYKIKKEETHLFKKSDWRWEDVHTEVRLDALQIRIPVKKIVPAAVEEDEEFDFDDDEFDEADDDFEEFDEEDEEVQAAPASAATAGLVCPKCGAVHKPAAKFCGSCGTKFAVQPKGKFCPNCGNSVSATAKFCGNCRTKV
jgi:hypothetical protein